MIILNNAAIVSPCVELGCVCWTHCAQWPHWGLHLVLPFLLGSAASGKHFCHICYVRLSAGHCYALWGVDVLRHLRTVVGTVDYLSNRYVKLPLACWQNPPPTVETENPRFSFFTQPWWMQPERMSALAAKKDFLSNEIEMHGMKQPFSSGHWDCGNPYSTARGKSKTESMLWGWQCRRSLASDDGVAWLNQSRQ